MSYFERLFGVPEPTRRANWDGREEPLIVFGGNHHLSSQQLEQKLAELKKTGSNDTIDIDYEEIP